MPIAGEPFELTFQVYNKSAPEQFFNDNSLGERVVYIGIHYTGIVILLNNKISVYTWANVILYIIILM